jgi:hypothetical protein
MQITRKSIISGIERTKDLDISEEQYNRWKTTGLLIQDAFPNLSEDDREFILTGITSDEWDKTFKDDQSDTEDVQ